MSNSDLISLWFLAKRLRPGLCSAYLAWYDISARGLSDGARQRAERAVKARFRISLGLSLDNCDGKRLSAVEKRAILFMRSLQWNKYLSDEEERQVERRRVCAAVLIGSYIPRVVQDALITGRYKVTGCVSDGVRRILSKEDIAVLTVDLVGNRLTAPGVIFNAVAVSELTAAEKEGGARESHSQEEKREDFFEWMNNEKVERGIYPGTAPDKQGRDGYKEWATKNGVTHAVIKSWVEEENLSNPSARPKKSVN